MVCCAFEAEAVVFDACGIVLALMLLLYMIASKNFLFDSSKVRLLFVDSMADFWASTTPVFWFDSSKVQLLFADSRADFLGQFLGCWFRVFRYIGDLCLFSLSASLLRFLYTLDVNKICLF